MQGEVLFRHLNDPVPSWSVAGCRWVVEFWTADMAYPIGQAWVMAAPGIMYLDWLNVMDEYRRQGIATQLLTACLKRWPDMLYDGATDAGEKFVDAFDGGPTP